MRPRDPRARRRAIRLMVTFWEPGNEMDYRSGQITNISDSGVFIVTEAGMGVRFANPKSEAVLSLIERRV